MGMAAIVGAVTAYPINSWLVKNHLKHGCMTIPDANETNNADDGSEASCGGMSMEMGDLPAGRAGVIVIATFAVMLAAGYATSIWVAPIRFGAVTGAG